MRQTALGDPHSSQSATVDASGFHTGLGPHRCTADVGCADHPPSNKRLRHAGRPEDRRGLERRHKFRGPMASYSNTNGSPSANSALTMITETKPIERKRWTDLAAYDQHRDCDSEHLDPSRRPRIGITGRRTGTSANTVFPTCRRLHSTAVMSASAILTVPVRRLLKIRAVRESDSIRGFLSSIPSPSALKILMWSGAASSISCRGLTVTGCHE